MLRVMLDTNIFDRIVETPGLAADLQSLTASGHLEVLVTHVQEDELAVIPDGDKRQAVQQVPRRSVATPVFIIGLSRLGEAALGGGHEGGVSLDRLAKLHRTRDAVIALTAAAREEQVEAFVTEDRRLARDVRAQADKLKVWDFATFRRECNKSARPTARG